MNLFQLLKYMFTGKSDVDIVVPKHDVWYDHDLRLWTAQLKDKDGNQIGAAGYGNTEKSAVDDAVYQNIDLLE